MNRLIKITIAICAVFLSLSLTAQINKYCGTYMPYDTDSLSFTSPPPGYHVKLINHVGRHGSRYPISGEHILYLSELLKNAHIDNGLTPKGIHLMNQLKEMGKLCGDSWGFLSDVGKAQERGIAQRLVDNYGIGVFERIYIRSDVEERCYQSGISFLDQIQEICNNTDTAKVDVMQRDNYLLNFFEVNEDYLEFLNNGSWKESLLEYTIDLLRNNKLIEEYVKPGVRLTRKDYMKFVLAMYNCVAIAPDIPLPLSVVPTLDDETMKTGWLIQNARHYLMRGPAKGYHDIQVDISKPLLRDFIESTDSTLNFNNYTTYLRFAHAETIIPFAALLYIPQASRSTASVDNISLLWKDYVVAPMAANIIWVVYENDKGHRLIKMMLNEREVPFPVETNIYPFYEWESVKQFYENLLNSGTLY